jgi:hypothetical protein
MWSKENVHTKRLAQGKEIAVIYANHVLTVLAFTAASLVKLIE